MGLLLHPGNRCIDPNECPQCPTGPCCENKTDLSIILDLTDLSIDCTKSYTSGAFNGGSIRLETSTVGLPDLNGTWLLPTTDTECTTDRLDTGIDITINIKITTSKLSTFTYYEQIVDASWTGRVFLEKDRLLFTSSSATIVGTYRSNNGLGWTTIYSHTDTTGNRSVGVNPYAVVSAWDTVATVVTIFFWTPAECGSSLESDVTRNTSTNFLTINTQGTGLNFPDGCMTFVTSFGAAVANGTATTEYVT